MLFKSANQLASGYRNKSLNNNREKARCAVGRAGPEFLDPGCQPHILVSNAGLCETEVVKTPVARRHDLEHVP